MSTTDTKNNFLSPSKSLKSRGLYIASEGDVNMSLSFKDVSTLKMKTNDMFNIYKYNIGSILKKGSRSGLLYHKVTDMYSNTETLLKFVPYVPSYNYPFVNTQEMFISFEVSPKHSHNKIIYSQMKVHSTQIVPDIFKSENFKTLLISVNLCSTNHKLVRTFPLLCHEEITSFNTFSKFQNWRIDKMLLYGSIIPLKCILPADNVDILNSYFYTSYMVLYPRINQFSSNTILANKAFTSIRFGSSRPSFTHGSRNQFLSITELYSNNTLFMSMFLVDRCIAKLKELINKQIFLACAIKFKKRNVLPSFFSSIHLRSKDKQKPKKPNSNHGKLNGTMKDFKMKRTMYKGVIKRSIMYNNGLNKKEKSLEFEISKKYGFIKSKNKKTYINTLEKKSKINIFKNGNEAHTSVHKKQPFCVKNIINNKFQKNYSIKKQPRSSEILDDQISKQMHNFLKHHKTKVYNPFDDSTLKDLSTLEKRIPDLQKDYTIDEFNSIIEFESYSEQTFSKVPQDIKKKVIIKTKPKVIRKSNDGKLNFKV